MVGLQFHVMVRKPDGTSIRMACFTSALWMAALLSGRLFLAFRGWSVSLAAFVVFLITAGADGASTYALLRRPLDMVIGRAPCRERVCPSVKFSVFARSFKKK